MSVAEDVAHIEEQLIQTIADRDRARLAADTLRALHAAGKTSPLERVYHHARCLADALEEAAAEKPDSALARKFSAWAIVLEHVSHEAKRVLGARR